MKLQQRILPHVASKRSERETKNNGGLKKFNKGVLFYHGHSFRVRDQDGLINRSSIKIVSYSPLTYTCERNGREQVFAEYIM